MFRLSRTTLNPITHNWDARRCLIYGVAPRHSCFVSDAFHVAGGRNFGTKLPKSVARQIDQDRKIEKTQNPHKFVVDLKFVSQAHVPMCLCVVNDHANISSLSVYAFVEALRCHPRGQAECGKVVTL